MSKTAILTCIASLVVSILLASAPPAHAIDSPALERVVDQRLLGDRTGACFAVAVIESRSVARAYRCSDPLNDGRIGPSSVFEIGSVAKTMAGAMLADMVLRGEMSLDDPLADHLPEGTHVPNHQGKPILLRHLVMHTSGLPRLPPGMDTADPNDPYAGLEVEDMLASLAAIKLEHAPGSQFEYSNLGTMLISVALAYRSGLNFEQLLDTRLFTPIGMDTAHIENAPDDVRTAVGHSVNGRPVPAWNFATDLAGAGGVRASLEDMVRYVQAQLGQRRSSADAALALGREPQPSSVGQPMAIGWLLSPLGDRVVHAHEGATGGFSSFVALDVSRTRGVVVLSDTSLFSLGGVGASMGMHLIDASFPLGTPLRPRDIGDMPADPAAFEGTYALAPDFDVVVRARDGAMFAQATGQQELSIAPLGGDTFAVDGVEAELHFGRDAAGQVVSVELHQGGQVVRGNKR